MLGRANVSRGGTDRTGLGVDQCAVLTPVAASVTGLGFEMTRRGAGQCLHDRLLCLMWYLVVRVLTRCLWTCPGMQTLHGKFRIGVGTGQLDSGGDALCC